MFNGYNIETLIQFLPQEINIRRHKLWIYYKYYYYPRLFGIILAY